MVGAHASRRRLVLLGTPLARRQRTVPGRPLALPNHGTIGEPHPVAHWACCLQALGSGASGTAICGPSNEVDLADSTESLSRFIAGKVRAFAMFPMQDPYVAELAARVELTLPIGHCEEAVIWRSLPLILCVVPPSTDLWLQAPLTTTPPMSLYQPQG